MLLRLETMALMGSMQLPIAAIRRQIASAIDILDGKRTWEKELAQSNVRHKVAARMEQAGGQLADWNFELRGAQSWVADEERWKYDQVKVHMPNKIYTFDL